METEVYYTQTLRVRLKLRLLVPGLTTRELLGWLRDGRCWLNGTDVVTRDGQAVAHALDELREADSRKWGWVP